MSQEEAVTVPLQNERGPSLDGSLVAVLGYRRSGRAAARLLREAGAEVRVTDTAALDELGVGEGEIPGGDAWIGTEDPAVLDGVDLVVASPGVPPSNPILAKALDSGRPVRSELELGWWFTDAPVVAVTGTNGKTTTTELLGAMGKAAGRETAVAGNVGTPLSSLAESRPELIVLEVSSFQLFLCEDFRPDVGAVLNLTSDHLDWHPDFEHYADAKANLFRRQRPEDVAVLNADDPEVMRRYSGVTSGVYTFSADSSSEPHAFFRDGRLTIRVGDELEPLFPLSEWRLAGAHNRENLLAAALCGRLIGLAPEAVAEGARGFRGLPHRMELVAEVDGVRWINDSKSTNPGSLAKALDPESSTLLIAGGVTKGCDFRPLREDVQKGARVVYLIGEGAADLLEAWRSTTSFVLAEDLETAVELAREEASPGERVLFSPGCASFDQFDNYAHRGDRFRDLVHRLSDAASREGGEG